MLRISSPTGLDGVLRASASFAQTVESMSYCWNLCGHVAATASAEAQKIQLGHWASPDETHDLVQPFRFIECPWPSFKKTNETKERAKVASHKPNL